MWTCAECAAAGGLDTKGQAVSAYPKGWCGAGRHPVVGEYVRYAPAAKVGAASPTPAAPTPPKLLPVQGELF